MTQDLRGVQVPNVASEANNAAIANDVALAKRTGANVVRVDLTWSRLEPKAKGAMDPGYLARLDTLMNEASRRGMQVLPTMSYTPCWASSAPASEKRNCGPSRDRGVQLYLPTNPQDFADTAAFLARRYGDKLAGIELWNEPDLKGDFFIKGPNRAPNYARLVKTTYPAIKAAAPNVKVVIGSLVNSNGKFLKELYANGIKGSYDALSVHYYVLTLASIRSIRRIQLAAGDRTPIWLTEVGFSACSPKRAQGEHLCVTRREQANFTDDILDSLKKTSYVDALILYALRDSQRYSFGLVTAAGRLKPVFAHVRRAFTRSPVKERKLTIKVANGIATGSGPVGDVYVISSFRYPEKQPRYTTIALQNAHGRFRAKLPAATRRGTWFFVLSRPWSKANANFFLDARANGARH